VGIEEPCKHDTLHKTTIFENYLIVQFSPYFCWGRFSMHVSSRDNAVKVQTASSWEETCTCTVHSMAI